MSPDADPRPAGWMESTRQRCQKEDMAATAATVADLASGTERLEEPVGEQLADVTDRQASTADLESVKGELQRQVSERRRSADAH